MWDNFSLENGKAIFRSKNLFEWKSIVKYLTNDAIFFSKLFSPKSMTFRGKTTMYFLWILFVVRQQFFLSCSIYALFGKVAMHFLLQPTAILFCLEVTMYEVVHSAMFWCKNRFIENIVRRRFQLNLFRVFAKSHFSSIPVIVFSLICVFDITWKKKRNSFVFQWRHRELGLMEEEFDLVCHKTIIPHWFYLNCCFTRNLTRFFWHGKNICRCLSTIQQNI